MKKVLLSFLISVLIISALDFGVGAEQYADTRDSRYIPPEDLAVINDPTAEIIVKAYSSDSISAFGYYDNIEDALAYYCTPKWIVYIKKNAEGLSTYGYFTDQSGVTKLIKETYSLNVNHSSVALQELQTGEAISAVSPDIAIESVYFMYGSPNYDGNAIYYKTNLGDYVYYRGAWGGPEMLCTAERFYEYKRAEYEEIVANNTGEVKNGGASVSDWDLSAYDYRSPNFNPAAPLPKGKDAFPWLGLGIVVLPLAAVLAVCIIRRKKSMQEAEM